MTRMLRENMRELGLDKEIEKAAVAIPDARDRLHYVATMTEQAADRALNAVDRAQPLQDQLSDRAEALDKRWAEWFEAPKSWTRPRHSSLRHALISATCPMWCQRLTKS
ncbi:hypothetical protein HSBAA_02110 [Vreelandella sulfidaeris]|uniref:Uncharacterized protein n=1 Tax=Vreelandella sulfidaeris TaxID=115553 RepID=A0A455TZY0_9GAMM|nr:hypothetical protein HSBAA_02110 [Halomonas sulfidaeris]